MQIGFTQRCDDQQDEVGTGRPRLDNLIRVDDEVLAQHGDRDRSADRFEISQRSTEAMRLREDTDGSGPTGCVPTGQCRRVGNRRDITLAGAGPLHLTDRPEPLVESRKDLPHGRDGVETRLKVAHRDV